MIQPSLGSYPLSLDLPAKPDSGPGRRGGRCGYNSGKTDSTNNLYLNTELGINRVAVRSTLTPGTITVTARRDGLKPAQIQIVANPVVITNGMATFWPRHLAGPAEKKDFLRFAKDAIRSALPDFPAEPLVPMVPARFVYAAEFPFRISRHSMIELLPESAEAVEDMSLKVASCYPNFECVVRFSRALLRYDGADLKKTR